MIIRKFFTRVFRGPDDGDGTGETKVDRGDEWVPTEDDEPAPKKEEPKAEKPLPKDKKGALKELAGKDDEPDEEDEPDEDEPKDEKKPAAKRIPLSRHQAVLDRERSKREAVERELAKYQGAKQVSEANEALTKLENEVMELQGAYDKALADGETAKASELMRKIRAHDAKIASTKNEGLIAAAEARAVERARYSITLERVEEAYPQLNEDHEDFDQDLYNEVVELMNAYVATGKYAPSAALQKAVRKELGAKTAAQKTAATVKARVKDADLDEDEDEQPDPQAKKRAERATAANEKALRAKEKSPATATVKAGLNSNDAGATRTAKDVIKMSQADFAKVDEKELAKLRGDFVEEDA